MDKKIDKDVNYVVTGWLRCGTSMMMQALIEGGMPAEFDPKRSRMNNYYGDIHYKPNEGGFFELNRRDYRKINFPSPYRGKLIKCLWGGLHRMCVNPNGYRYIFMLRNREECRQSYEAFFDQPAPDIAQNDQTYYPQRNKYLDLLENRKDTLSVHQIKYRDMIEDPLKYFQQLSEEDWPIDPEKAAEVVKPELCRFRLEKLEIGI